MAKRKEGHRGAKNNQKTDGKRVKLITAAIAAVAVVAAVICFVFVKKDNSNNNDSIQNDTSLSADEQETSEEETVVKDEHPNEQRSRITGKWIDKSTADNVPVAVMFSNVKAAMPQSSISEADIVFESLVEGGITRLCCVFENKPQLDKIGPVRSCRTYYLLFAKEFEAGYVHFGYSEYAEQYLKQDKFHSLDGMVYCDFYRTSDRKAPHNAYTSWSGIMQSYNAKGYPAQYSQDYNAPFTFNTDDSNDITIQNGQACNKFYPGYPYNKPYFEYNAATKEYLRFQFDGPQVDQLNGQQLSYKNILVKYVEPAYYPNGTPNYKISGTRKGIFITDGKAVNVTWKKDSETEGPTKYYYEDGTEVVLNQGKTFICQVETSQGVSILEQ